MLQIQKQLLSKAKQMAKIMYPNESWENMTARQRVACKQEALFASTLH